MGRRSAQPGPPNVLLLGVFVFGIGNIMAGLGGYILGAWMWWQLWLGVPAVAIGFVEVLSVTKKRNFLKV